MTNLEFSREFDILYNNITSNQAPSLNSYEKSVFLTEAEEQYQEELISEIGGDSNNRVLALLNPFIVRKEYSSSEAQTVEFGFERRNTNAVCFQAENKDDVIIILRESAMCHDDNCASHPCNGYPVREDEVNYILMNPFRFNKNIVLRVDEYSEDSSDYRRILIYKGELDSYTIVYVRRCKPIVLFDSDNEYELSVNGVTDETPCEFPASCHRRILELAVLRAKAAWDPVAKQQTD
jgi:flagellar assembly factor FliW